MIASLELLGALVRLTVFMPSVRVVPPELIIGRSWAVLAPAEHRRWVNPQ